MLPDFRVRQRDYLLEISRALTEELDLDVLLTRILKIAIEMLSGHAGFIALSMEESWKIAVHQSIPTALLTYLENWMRSLSTAEDDENRVPEINKMLSGISMGMLTGVGIPMIVERFVIGQIYVFRNYRTAFSANDYSILNSFANQAAIAVRNARLYNEIKDQNLRVNALIETVADGILILNPDFVVTSVNAAYARLIYTSASTLEGKPYAEVVRWAAPPKGVRLDEASKSNWTRYTREEMYLEGDLLRVGGLPPLPVAITYAPLFSNEGKLLNVIATVRDITRFREAEDMKTSFISVISHELKTPIALIKGYANTLRREDANWDMAVVQESLAVIENEADHLALMVEDLLDATRLQAGGIALKTAPVDLYQLAAETVKHFSTQSQSHKIVSTLQPDFPIIQADEIRINQLLSNLVSNSLKYAERGKITISGETRPNEVQICVTDQGQGFDPMDIPHLFERFYRSTVVSATTKGTGLGLYLCKSIVAAHGGRIWVDESYHEGGRICFTLPRASSIIKT